MSIVFVEYRIQPEYVGQYKQWMHDQLMRLESKVEWLEGSDQPGLFVEIWRGLTYEQYQKMKQLRILQHQEEAGEAAPACIDDFTSWQMMGDWIVGGVNKLHIWHFGDATVRQEGV